MGKSNIEWTDMVWNPVTGCTKVSPGCANCYAERMAMRFTGHFNVTCHPDRLDQPLHWKKSRRIFVCSMGDLFHEDVPDDFIHDVLRTVFILPKHQFLVLTKRPERAREYFLSYYNHREFGRNLWLGVTAENQEWWEKRKEAFFATPAAIHFVSNEPLLGKIVYTEEDLRRIDWAIVGAESGAGRRMMDAMWAFDIVEQCKKARVPVFVKQIHCSHKPGDEKNFFISKNMDEWPKDLRVREFPNG